MRERERERETETDRDGKRERDREWLSIRLLSIFPKYLSIESSNRILNILTSKHRNELA